MPSILKSMAFLWPVLSILQTLSSWRMDATVKLGFVYTARLMAIGIAQLIYYKISSDKALVQKS